MSLEHGNNSIVSFYIKQGKEKKHTVGFVNSCKTSKVNCQQIASVSNNLSTSPRRFAVVTCGTAQHAWYRTNRLAVDVFAPVKLCICGRRMHLEYGHNQIVTDSPSRKVHNITEQFAVVLVTAKHMVQY